MFPTKFVVLSPYFQFDFAGGLFGSSTFWSSERKRLKVKVLILKSWDNWASRIESQSSSLEPTIWPTKHAQKSFHIWFLDLSAVIQPLVYNLCKHDNKTLIQYNEARRLLYPYRKLLVFYLIFTLSNWPYLRGKLHRNNKHSLEWFEMLENHKDLLKSLICFRVFERSDLRAVYSTCDWTLWREMTSTICC